MKPERIAALADGIFAIAMTLLILDIHVPEVAFLSRADIIPLLPKLLALATSFIILAIYWSSHHMLFARIAKSDFGFMWRNMYLLLAITLVPFVTALLGSYPYSHLAQSIYGIVLIVCASILYHIIYYATRIKKLVYEEPSLEFRRNVAGKTLIPALAYITAIILGFWHLHLSLLLLVCGPLCPYR
jgi:uncharacterized membrane protein